MSKRGDRYADHPLVKFVRSMDGEFYLAREVAEMLECTDSYLTYLQHRSERPLGPTHQASYGGILLHLYTPERVAEMAEFMKANRGDGPRRGQRSLWSRTESLQRTRDIGRARNYQRRGRVYAEQGQTEQATRMEQMRTNLLSELELARIQRWEEVHGRPWTPDE